MSNRTALRMRVLPRFPARISATNGLEVVRDNHDLVVRPDFGSLVQVPSVSSPTTTFFWGWDQTLDSYSSISFQNLVDNIQDVIIGENLAGIADLTVSANQVPYYLDGDGNAATYTVSEYVRSVSDAADETAFLTAIGAATAAQGELADSALQPGEAATVEQGTLADTAVQPGDLGGAATLNVGTSAGTVAAGDDSRITGALQPAASVTALKALSASSGKTVSLIESGREGIFAFRSGDYSAQIAADTLNAVFIKADATAATSGAWVRQDGWLVSGLNIRWFGATGDGTTDDTTALQAALSLANSLSVKRVYGGGGGTYIFSSTLSVPAGVLLEGDFKTTLKQKNTTNLSELISLATEGKLVNWIVDGNRSNNTDNLNHVAVRVGNSNDCVVEKNIIKNCTGNGIVSNIGFRASVKSNTIFNFYEHGIAIYGANSNYYHTIEDNYIHTVGWAGIVVSNSDHTDVRGNRIVGQLIGGRGSRISANSSGSTLTWVSGPNFSTVIPGNFVTINSGEEYRVTAATSTSITVSGTLPTLSGTEVSVGSGDLIGIIGSNFCTIAENILDTTATFLFGFSLGSTVVQCGNNLFANNTLSFAGKNAINLNGAVGSGFLDNNSIIGNKIFNAGYGGGIGTVDRIAIFLAGGGPGQVNNTYISDNTVVSFAGTGQTTYWLGTDGLLSFGSVFVNGNKALDVANKGISGDVVTLALSSDWGSTAAVSNITSHGDKLIFTITCSGTGYASNPNFTISKIVDTPNDPPIVTAKISSNSGGALLSTMWGEQLSTRGIWKAYMAATPASGHVYVMIVKA